jgi:hypothetical protein
MALPTRMTTLTRRLAYMPHMNPSMTTAIAAPITRAMYDLVSLQRTWSSA